MCHRLRVCGCPVPQGFPCKRMLQESPRANLPRPSRVGAAPRLASCIRGDSWWLVQCWSMGTWRLKPWIKSKHVTSCLNLTCLQTYCIDLYLGRWAETIKLVFLVVSGCWLAAATSFVFHRFLGAFSGQKVARKVSLAKEFGPHVPCVEGLGLILAQTWGPLQTALETSWNFKDDSESLAGLFYGAGAVFDFLSRFSGTHFLVFPRAGTSSSVEAWLVVIESLIQFVLLILETLLKLQSRYDEV